MPAPPRLTLWSYWWFNLKWILLILPVAGVCSLLLQSGHPALMLLPIIVYLMFFVHDSRRLLRPIRGTIIRRVGGYVENPRNLWRTIISTAMTVALCYLLVVYSAHILLALLTVLAITAVLRPFAIRNGWFEEGRIAARFHRPRFIDERFRVQSIQGVERNVSFGSFTSMLSRPFSRPLSTTPDTAARQTKTPPTCAGRAGRA